MPTTYAIPNGRTVMDATLWTGDGSTNRTMTTGTSFKPDLIWIKQRSAGALSHILYDTIRGASTGSTSAALVSNVNDAQGANNDNSTYGYLDSFTSSGFTTVRGSNGTTSYTNANGNTYVAWQWQAGQGTTTTNNLGSISSTTSVNATAGFSIATYTGNGTNGASIGHGLSATPAMVIIKQRSAANSWVTYNQGISSPTNNFLVLEGTSATQSASGFLTPSSTLLTFTTSYGGTNGSAQTYVAYSWTPIAGFSQFGGYTGNGSTNGPFIYAGFRPKFVLIKQTDLAGNWIIWDTSRSTYNQMQDYLVPNSSQAESNNVVVSMDALSNGFKFRCTDDDINGNGNTYIYMAFAENPFKYANAR